MKKDRQRIPVDKQQRVSALVARQRKRVLRFLRSLGLEAD
jgi:hypothetical protein